MCMCANRRKTCKKFALKSNWEREKKNRERVKKNFENKRNGDQCIVDVLANVGIQFYGRFYVKYCLMQKNWLSMSLMVFRYFILFSFIYFFLLVSASSSSYYSPLFRLCGWITTKHRKCLLSYLFPLWNLWLLFHCIWCVFCCWYCWSFTKSFIFPLHHFGTIIFLLAIWFLLLFT